MIPELVIAFPPFKAVPDQTTRSSLTLAKTVQGLHKVLVCHGLLQNPLRCKPDALEAGKWWTGARYLPLESLAEQGLAELIREFTGKYSLPPKAPLLCVLPSAGGAVAILTETVFTEVAGRRCLGLRLGTSLDAMEYPPSWYSLFGAASHLLFPKLQEHKCFELQCIGRDIEWALASSALHMPPTYLCGKCRGAVGARAATKLAGLAEWISENASVRLSDVGAEREARVRCLSESGIGSVRLTNAALLAHAENIRVTAVSPKLGDSVHAILPDGKEATKTLSETRDRDIAVVPACRGILRGLMSEAKPIDAAVAVLDGLTPYVDSLLHVTTKRGRDHAQHMCATALMSQFIGDSVVHLGAAQALSDHACRASGLSYEEWCRAIWFAGMLHDIGYPFAALADVWSLTDEGLFPDGHHEVIWGHPIRQVLASLRRVVDEAAGKHKELAPATTAIREFFSLKSDKAMLQRLQDALEEHPLEPWFPHPEAWLALRRKLLRTAAGRSMFFFDHGMWSALLCVLALEQFGISPAGGNTNAPGWLRYAVQAIALHNHKLSSYDGEAIVAQGPLKCTSGKAVSFDFLSDPVTFMLRLADKIQVWERLVRADATLVAETECIRLENIIWPLAAGDGRPLWLGQPVLVLDYDDQRRLLSTGWDYSFLQRDLARDLAELPFPADEFGCPVSPRERGKGLYISFRISPPRMDPKKWAAS